MFKKLKFTKTVSNILLATFGVVLFGCALASLTTSINQNAKHSQPVYIDTNYESLFGGVRILNANDYGTEGTDYTENLGYLVKGEGTELNPYEACVFYGDASDNDVVIPMYYTSGGKQYKVTAIDYSGFANLTSLTSVTFQVVEGVSAADNITLIDAQAFAGCPNLSRFNSASTGEFSIPKNLTVINDATFMNDVSLTKLSFESNRVAQIGANAFANCTALASNLFFRASANGLAIGDSAFSNCYNIPIIMMAEGVTSIGNLSFYNCHRAKYIIIPGTLATIGTDAFRLCTSATAYIPYDTKFPSGTTQSGGLSLNWPCESSTQIKEGNWNYAYKNNEIPVQLNRNNIAITDNYLYSAQLTETIDINTSETVNIFLIHIISCIEDFDSPNVTIPQTLPVSSNESSVLEHSSGTQIGVVAYIDNGVFAEHSEITNLTIPNTLISIGDYAFFANNNITTLNLNDKNLDDTFYLYDGSHTDSTAYHMNRYSVLTGLTNIGDHAFASQEEFPSNNGTPTTNLTSNSKVTSLSIPSTVQVIGDYAFFGFTKGTSLTFNSANSDSALKTIGDEAFMYFGYTSGGSFDLRLPKDLVNYNSQNAIGSRAFQYALPIQSVYFYDTANTISARTIDTYAFANCTNIEYAYLQNVKTVGDNSFNGCTIIDWTYISASCTSLSNSAFSNTSYMQLYWGGASKGTSTTYKERFIEDKGNGNNAVAIANSPFKQNGFFIEYTVPTYTYIDGVYTDSNDIPQGADKYVFSDEINGYQYLVDKTGGGGSTVTTLTHYLHYISPSSINTSTASDTITAIGDGAFYNNTTLTSITLNNQITTIGKCAFWNASNLSTCILPTGLTTIGDFAFVNTSVTSFNISASTTSIGSYALWYNTQLTSLTVADGNTIYKTFDTDSDGTHEPALYQITGTNQYKLLYMTGKFTDSYDILDGTTVIGSLALTSASFTNTTKVNDIYTNRKLYIPTSVTTIEPYAMVMLSKTNILSGSAGFVEGNYVNSKEIYIVNPTLVNICLTNKANSNLSVIGAFAFSHQRNALQIDLPNNSSVNRLNINEMVFRFCDSMESISFPESTVIYYNNTAYCIGNNMFDRCTGLNTHITFTDGIQQLNRSAFFGCCNIPSVSFTNIKVIGEQAFLNCTGITEVTFIGADTLKTIGQLAFSMNTGWGSYGDYNYIRLTTINRDTDGDGVVDDHKFPATLTTIGNSAFKDTKELTSIDLSIATSLKNFGTNVFENSAISSAVWTTGCSSIPNYTFKNCPNLTSLTNINHITSIGKQAFCKCTSLSSFTIPSTVTKIEEDGDNGAFREASNLVTVTYSSNMTTIPQACFYGCTKLETITNIENVVTIRKNAFYNCQKLKESTLGSSCFDIPSSCQNIEEKAFYQCYALTKSTTNITIPSSATITSPTNLFILPNTLRSISQYAFQKCTGLTNVYMEVDTTSSTTIGKRGQYIFAECKVNNLTIYTNLTYSYYIGTSPTIISDSAWFQYWCKPSASGAAFKVNFYAEDSTTASSTNTDLSSSMYVNHSSKAWYLDGSALTIWILP